MRGDQLVRFSIGEAIDKQWFKTSGREK